MVLVCSTGPSVQAKDVFMFLTQVHKYCSVAADELRKAPGKTSIAVSVQKREKILQLVTRRN